MLKRALAALCFALAAGGPARAAQKVLDANAIYPEAAQFVGDALYVAELPSNRVLVYRRASKRTFFHEDGCGPASVRPYRGALAVFCHLGGEIVVVGFDGRVTARIGKGVLRDPNDGWPDGKGGLYLSDPGLFSRDTRPNGVLYHLTAAGALVAVDSEDLWYPNGVYVERARLFMSETFRRKIWTYDIAPDGRLTHKTLFADIDRIAPPAKYRYREAGPDGLARAPNGELVVAMYGEGRLLRLSNAGALVGQIETPFQYTDNVAFGAPGAVIMGAYDNINPPMRGALFWWTP